MKVLKTTFVLAALGFALSAGQAWAQSRNGAWVVGDAWIDGGRRAVGWSIISP